VVGTPLDEQESVPTSLTFGQNEQILAQNGERTRLPRLALETNRRKVVARLEREGWSARQGGDHDVFKHPSKPGRIIVAVTGPSRRV